MEIFDSFPRNSCISRYRFGREITNFVRRTRPRVFIGQTRAAHRWTRLELLYGMTGLVFRVWPYFAIWPLLRVFGLLAPK